MFQASDDGPRPGEILPSMRSRTKAHAYVDLLLAPRGQALIAGEPVAFINEVGHENLMACSTDEMEIVAAMGGLEMLVDEDPKIVMAALAVRAAEVMHTLCAWLAFTPFIGARTPPTGFKAADRCNFKAPEGEQGLTMTAEQSGRPYFAVITSALAVLRTVCDPPSAVENAEECINELCKSKHGALAVLRCVELVGRYTVETTEPELTALLLAREAICALAAARAPVASFLCRAAHPFNPSRSARSLLEAMEVASPHQMPSTAPAAPVSITATAFDAIASAAIADGAMTAEMVESLRSEIDGFLDDGAREEACQRCLDSLLAKGTRVRLVDLVSRADLNDEQGTISSERGGKGGLRYPVALDCQQARDTPPLGLQAINLRLARANGQQ